MKKIVPDPPVAMPYASHAADITRGVETFCDVGNPEQHLFRVQPGILLDDAYEQVSVLLGYIQHLVREGDLEDDHKLLGAADYLSAMAKALMNDIERAKSRRPWVGAGV